MSSEDLTKLSGPELADHVGNATNVSDSYVQMVGKEAARRLRNIDQRDERIESLSAQLRAADKRVMAAERALSARTVATVGGRVSELERELERWREWKDGLDCVPVAADDDTAMDAIGDRCATLHRIEAILGVEDSDEEGAGYEALRKVVAERDHWKSKAIGTQAQIDRDDRIAQGMSTAELVAELEQRKVTMAGMHAARGELQRELDAATKRIAELEDQLREKKAPDAQALPRKSYPIEIDLTPDCAPIAESPFPAAVAVAHTWGAGKGTTPLSEPAERKPHEGRVYGPDARTLDNVLADNGWASTTTHHLAAHLRELLDERKAIEVLAEEFRLTGREEAVASRLREVLNGKR